MAQGEGMAQGLASTGMKLPAGIEAWIFDFGRVITTDPDRTKFTDMADLLGAPHPEFLHAYASERHEYDRGVLSAADYWARVAGHFGAASAKPAAVDAATLARLVRLDMDAWFRLDPAMVAFLRDLRPLVPRLLLLSNINVEGKERLLGQDRFCEGFDWLSLFDGMILSCDLKLVKPDRAIYERIVEMAGVEAGKCLFVDDSPANVEGARAAGLKSLEYRGLADLRAALERM